MQCNDSRFFKSIQCSHTIAFVCSCDVVSNITLVGYLNAIFLFLFFLESTLSIICFISDSNVKVATAVTQLLA